MVYLADCYIATRPIRVNVDWLKERYSIKNTIPNEFANALHIIEAYNLKLPTR